MRMCSETPLKITLLITTLLLIGTTVSGENPEVLINDLPEEAPVSEGINVEGSADVENIDLLEIQYREEGMTGWFLLDGKQVEESPAEINSVFDLEGTYEFRVRAENEDEERFLSEIQTVTLVDDVLQVDNLSVDTDNNNYTVGEKVTASLEFEGSNAEEAYIYLVDVETEEKTILGDKESCENDCKLTRTYEAEQPGDFQVVAKVEGVNSDGETTEFTDGTEITISEPVTEVNDLELKASEDQIPLGSTVNLDLSFEGSNGNLEIVRKTEGSREILGDQEFCETDCSISRQFETSERGAQEFVGVVKDSEEEVVEETEPVEVDFLADPKATIELDKEEVVAGDSVEIVGEGTGDWEGEIFIQRRTEGMTGWTTLGEVKTCENPPCTVERTDTSETPQEIEYRTRILNGEGDRSEPVSVEFVEAEDPSASLEVIPQISEIGQNVEFNAEGSQSNDPSEIETYRFDFNNDGSYDIETEDAYVSKTFEDPVEQTARVEVETTAGLTDTATAEYQVELDVEPADLVVKTEDSDGEPLPGSSVKVENDVEQDKTTGTDGSAEFELLPGDYNIEVSRSGYEEKEREISLEEGENRLEVFMLEEDEVKKGTLTVNTEDSNGNKLPGVEVEIENNETSIKSTGSDGSAEFLLNPGTYSIEGRKDGYFTATDTVGIEDDGSHEVDLELGRQPDLEITQFDIPKSVCRGEDFRADFTIRNNRITSQNVEVTGSAPGSYNVGRNLDIGPYSSRSSYMTFTDVDGDGMETVELRVDGYDQIVRTKEIMVEDCVAERTVTEADALSINTNEESVTAGESIQVYGYVDGIRGRSNVDIELDEDEETSISTNRGGFYSTRIRPDSTGSKRITATSRGLRKSTEVEVLPTVRVYSMDVQGTAYSGQEFELCADVETQDTAKVVLEREGEEIKSRNDVGETCFTTVEPDAGEYQYSIRAEAKGASDTISRRVEVYESGDEAESFPGHVAMERSGPGIVRVDLANRGQEGKRYFVEVDSIPSSWVSQDRQSTWISPGREETIYVYFTPKQEGNYEPEITVRRDEEEIMSRKIEMTAGGTTQTETRLWPRIRRILGL